MYTYFRNVLCALILMSALDTVGQTGDVTSFEFFFSNLPKAADTPEATMKEFNMEAYELTIGKVNRNLMANLSAAYKPLANKIRANIAAGKNDKLLLSRLSQEERALTDEFGRGMVGLGDDAQDALIHLIMAKRPFLSSGKISWTPALSRLNPTELEIYKKLLEVEKSFSWQAFNEKVSKQYYSWTGGDLGAATKKVDQKFSSDLSGLPRKNVKIYDEVAVEMEDPAKAIVLSRNYQVEKQKLLKMNYEVTYKEWRKNYDSLYKLCGTMESIMNAYSVSGDPISVDDVLGLAIYDVSARLWHALEHLSMLTSGVIMQAVTADYAWQQTEATIQTYQKYIDDAR